MKDIQSKIISQKPLAIEESRTYLGQGNAEFGLELGRYEQHNGPLKEIPEYDAIVLTCSDARCDCSLFRDFVDSRLLFLQVAGNVYDSHSAVARAKVNAAIRKLMQGGLLIQMGHAKCGAVDANAHADQYIGKVSRQVDTLIGLVDRRHSTTFAEDDYKANTINQALRLAEHPEIVKKGVRVIPCLFDFTDAEQKLLEYMKEGAEPGLVESLRASGVSRLKYANDNGYMLSAQYAHTIIVSDPIDMGRFSNPRIIFNSRLNEIFAVSAIGTEISDDAIASMEYALLKVNGVKDAPHIVIVHSRPDIAKKLKEIMLGESSIIKEKTKNGQLMTVMQYNQSTGDLKIQAEA